MIGIPIGVLVLFMLFIFLLAGMVYEAYIRPRLLMNLFRTKSRRKPHMVIKARKV